jgi:hypothetical protein
LIYPFLLFLDGLQFLSRIARRSPLAWRVALVALAGLALPLRVENLRFSRNGRLRSYADRDPRLERKGFRRGISKELPRSLGEVSGRWALVRIAGDIERLRCPRSSLVPKPTVDKPLSLPTFKVYSMSNVVRVTESASAIRAVGMRLAPRSTAQAVVGGIDAVHQMSRPMEEP